MRTAICLAALLLLLPAVGLADEKAPSVADEVKAYFAAKDANGRAAVALRLSMSGADPEAVRAAIPGARTWPKAKEEAGHVTGWKRTVGEKEHTIYARLPASYDPAKAYPAIVWLHGGVRRDQDGGGAYGANALGERADEHGFIIVSPSAHSGLTWWAPDGVQLIRDALEDAKARWHIDTNRVYVTGFSDGGSGCYHLLAHDPAPYAAILPLMGHPAITRMMGGPTYAANVASRPVWAVNGGRDRLYPSSGMKPLIDALKEAGCDLTWTDLPEAGHSLGHVADIWNELWAFVQAHPRKPLSPVKQLTTWDPSRGARLDWIEIVRVDPKAPGDAKLAPNELSLPRRATLGIRGDVRYPGPGVRIAAVEDGTPASGAGLIEGDILMKIGETDLGDAAQAMRALRDALTVRGNAKEVRLALTVLRDEEEKSIEVTIPVSTQPAGAKELGYGAPAARIHAERASASRIVVRTHQVGSFRLHLAPGLVDLTKPLEVIVNGKPAFAGVPNQNVAHMLAEAWRGGGAKPHYAATLLIDVK